MGVEIRPRECARTIENISKIRMDVARATGDEIWTKSDLDQENRFLTSKSGFDRPRPSHGVRF